MDLKTFLPVVVGPLIAAIIGLIFSNMGIFGKQKRIEYYLKRLELVDRAATLSAANKDRSEINVLQALLQSELLDIISIIRSSSIREEEQAKIDFDLKPWYQRVFPPKSSTVGGRFGIIIFYLYAICGFFYIFIFFFALYYSQNDFMEPKYALFGMVASFVTAGASRLWAIRSARRQAILGRAKRLLAIYEESKPPMPQY
jgi:hypothetical protein